MCRKGKGGTITCSECKQPGHNKLFHTKGNKGGNSETGAASTQRSSTEVTTGTTPPMGSTGVVLQWMPDVWCLILKFHYFSIVGTLTNTF
ncbi:unnamed protein product, partial [Linum tenue]